MTQAIKLHLDHVPVNCPACGCKQVASDTTIGTHYEDGGFDSHEWREYECGHTVHADHYNYGESKFYLE